MTTAVATGAAALSAADRCDRCGAQAYLKVELLSGGELRQVDTLPIQTVEIITKKPCWLKSRATAGLAAQHVELMAKDKVFGFQRGPRPEQPDQSAPDQSAKIAHRSDYQPIRERQSAVWVCGRDTRSSGNRRGFGRLPQIAGHE